MGRVYERWVDGVTPGVDPCLLRFGHRNPLCRVALGLTLYVHDPAHWERGGVSRLLNDLTRTWGAREAYYQTSLLPGWARVPPERGIAEVAEGLRWYGSRPRHHFRFRIGTDPYAADRALTYRVVDPALSVRASHLTVALPQDAEPDELLQLALVLANEAPFLSGVGGFVAVWNEKKKPVAFQAIHAWCRRYLGLDVQDPDAFNWSARRWLSGVGWLTLVGNELAASVGLPTQPLVERAWEHGVGVVPTAHGVLVRAGERPTLGDLNRFDYPHAYREVAQALADHLDEAPRELPGTFWEEEQTAAWSRRFIEPEGWR